MYYWQAIMKAGPVISNEHGVSLLSVDRVNIRVFQLVDDRTGRIVFATGEYVVAWRRRTAMKQGGGKQVVHIIELANLVVFVFEDTGKIVRLHGYGTEWWNRPIEYLPGEQRGLTCGT